MFCFFTVEAESYCVREGFVDVWGLWRGVCSLEGLLLHACQMSMVCSDTVTVRYRNNINSSFYGRLVSQDHHGLFCFSERVKVKYHLSVM